ncbi:MAG: type II secretion system ATPase GspE [Firmicutes bacterium]|nr:type II secretion system ATPase GspE [Bacillota bacterium]
MSAGMHRRLLGDILVEYNLITPAQLEEALKVQRETGERLGEVLVRLGYVSEDDILEVLEYQLGIPRVSLADKPLSPDLVRSLPESLIRRHKVLPLRKEGSTLTVAVADPLNVVALDDLRFATGLEINPVIARRREIEEALERCLAAPEMGRAIQELAMGMPEEEARPARTEEAAAEEAPVVRLVNSLLSRAIAEKASDIHIEPQEQGVRVRYRIDGSLREIMQLPKRVQALVTSRIKIMANLDIAEKRVPQDGRIQLRQDERDIDMRVSTMPTVFGEKIVIRLLDKSSALLNLNQLGFSSQNLARFNALIRSSYGMILVTGPTGSGKTTTLYAVLNELNTSEKNIITIEDPVEYTLPGVNQTGINPKAGLTFATGLRSILRQDPDIIMVGEIRDAETAAIAVRAATTGHLVLSTMHTNDAAGAFARLIDMGVEPFLVASSVLGVVAQRLVRVVCPRCREAYELSPDTPEYAFVNSDKPVRVFRGRGCAACGYTGYKGRTSIQEVLVATRSIRALINAKAPAGEIRRCALEEGMVPLKEDGIAKALEGVTALQEVIRVTYAEE